MWLLAQRGAQRPQLATLICICGLAWGDTLGFVVKGIEVQVSLRCPTYEMVVGQLQSLSYRFH